MVHMSHSTLSLIFFSVQIQDALENHKLPEEDTLLMALAGLKQVKTSNFRFLLMALAGLNK